MKLELRPAAYPNQCGEALRAMFFKPNGFHVFNLNDGCYEVPGSAVPWLNIEDGKEEWIFDRPDPSDKTPQMFRVFAFGSLIMLYYIDGDITLIFYDVTEPNGVLINTDAKKSYGWKYYETFKEAWLGENECG